jgi:hypothetical protein
MAGTLGFGFAGPSTGSSPAIYDSRKKDVDGRDKHGP